MLFLILILITVVELPMATYSETIAVCGHGEKSINCSDATVIYIDWARHGRVGRGKCWNTTSTGSSDCSADVRFYLEKKCAGRRSCIVKQDTVLEKSPHGCHPDFMTHLEMSYRCLPVETPDVRAKSSQSCTGSRYLVRPVTSSGYLARVVTVETDIGSKSCPWSIEVQSGQTIHLTLIDFGIWNGFGGKTEGHQQGGRQQCTVYATITDRTNPGVPSPQCGGPGQPRERPLFSSTSNNVEVAVSKDPELDYFLIRYQVVGCPDLVPPSDTSFERTGDRLVAKCTIGDDQEAKREGSHGNELTTWTLLCINGTWSESRQVNCSNLHSSSSPKNKSSSESSHQGVLLAIAISVAFIVAVLVSTLGIFFIFRRRVSKSNQVELPLSDDYRFIPAQNCDQQRMFGNYQWSQGPAVYGSTPQQFGTLSDGSRRPSIEFLERDYATTLQMRINAASPLLASPVFSCSSQHPSVSDPPYSSRAMMVYCPYHGTLTRVIDDQPKQVVDPEIPTSHPSEDAAGEAVCQSPRLDVYDELNFDELQMSPVSK